MTNPCLTCGLAPGDCPWCSANTDRQAEHAWPEPTRRLKRWLGRVVRTGNALRKDGRVPRPIRWALCISPFCLLIVGPFDEIIVGVLLLALVVFWREPLLDAWRSTSL